MVHSSLFAGRVSAAASTRFFDFFLPFFFEIGIDVSIRHRYFSPSTRNENFPFAQERFVIVPFESLLLSRSDYCAGIRSISERYPSKRPIIRFASMHRWSPASKVHQRFSQQREVKRVLPFIACIPSLRSCHRFPSLASKGNTRFFVYITLIKRLHSPRTYRDNINHAEHSNNLIFTRTRYKFISFILPFATSNPCSRVFTTHDCAIGNTILLLRLQKRIEAFSQAERAWLASLLCRSPARESFRGNPRASNYLFRMFANNCQSNPN